MKISLKNYLIRNINRFLSEFKKLPLWIYFLFLFSGIVLLASFRSSERESPQGEYITMRIYENFTVTSSRIIIVYADDKSEIIELAPFKFNDDYLVKNNQVITRTLNKLRKDGFRIAISSSGGKVSSSRDMMITTYILER